MPGQFAVAEGQEDCLLLFVGLFVTVQCNVGILFGHVFEVGPGSNEGGLLEGIAKSRRKQIYVILFFRCVISLRVLHFPVEFFDEFGGESWSTI